MTQRNEIPTFRPTWATVDLDALRYNFGLLRRSLSVGTEIMAMIKADAYGHGALPVAKVLENDGARAFGVATVEEGLELRKNGIKKQILVMGGLLGAGAPASKVMVECDLTPVIHSHGVIASLENDAKEFGKKIPVHLKIDTGMSRLGVRPESLDSVLSRLASSQNLYLEGVMTHFMDAGDGPLSREQFDIFIQCKQRIEASLGKVKIWHMANSQGITNSRGLEIPGADEVWVRPGLALFGGMDDASLSSKRPLPVMGLASRVVLLKHVPEGARVSYSGIFVTQRKTRLAIVPIGYADGYPWSLAGKASVLIRGVRAPVVGRVTMDMIIVDVTDIDDIEIHDEVVLMGSQGSDCISMNDLARWAETIPYEILCGISKRMPRVYSDENPCKEL